jgi:hypothetical protein
MAVVHCQRQCRIRRDPHILATEPECVVEMISELLDPLNAREKLSSYIDLLLATYPSVRGYLAPSELKWSSSELNIRDPS